MVGAPHDATAMHHSTENLRLPLVLSLFITLSGACDRRTTPSEPAAPPANSTTALAALPSTPVDQIVLDGTTVDVDWADGDSLRITSGPMSGEGARIDGYNTLEAYAPVHRWGDWSYDELGAVNSRSTIVARGTAWSCTSTGEGGGFGRALIRCPTLQAELVRRGLAHLFTMDEPFPPETLALQAEAQAAGRGIWAEGVPDAVVTSVSSTADGFDRTFDRVVDSTSGYADRVFHEENHQPCDEICHEGSCMLYLPYERRFGPEQIVCAPQN